MTALPLPKIPTDNLYKFLALSGLLLVGFSFYWPSHEADQWHARLDTLNERVAVFNSKGGDEVRQPYRKMLMERSAAFVAAVSKPMAPQLAAAMLPEAQATKAQLEAEMLRLIDLEQAETEEQARLLAERDVVQRIEKRMDFRSEECTWLSGIGAMMAVMGFMNWYTKIQKHQDRAFAPSAGAVDTVSVDRHPDTTAPSLVEGPPQAPPRLGSAPTS